MTKTEYLLVTLMEECAEVQKECSKCLRFGIGDKESYHNPNSPDTLSNVERLNDEVNDLMGTLELLFKDGTIELPYDEKIQMKVNKVEQMYNEFHKDKDND